MKKITIYILCLLMCIASFGMSGCNASKNKPQKFFGIYHLDPDSLVLDGKKAVESSFTNVYVINYHPVGSINVDEEKFDSTMQEIKKNNKFVWLFGYHYIWQYNNKGKLEVRSDAKDKLKELKAYLDSKDYNANVLGIKLDEPFWNGMTNQNLLLGTKNFYEIFGNEKRMYVNFSAAAFDESISIGGGLMTERMKKESITYITDCSFDFYFAFEDGYRHRLIFNNMKEIFSDNKKINYWLIPCCMNFLGDKKEEYVLENINGYYEMYKTEKNVVGMIAYTWHTFLSSQEDIGNIGLKDLLVDDIKPYKDMDKTLRMLYLKYYDDAGNSLFDYVNGKKVNRVWNTWVKTYNLLNNISDELTGRK